MLLWADFRLAMKCVLITFNIIRLHNWKYAKVLYRKRHLLIIFAILKGINVCLIAKCFQLIKKMYVPSLQQGPQVQNQST